MDTRDDMTATDVFIFNVHAAKLEYLLDKRRRGEKVERIPCVPAEPMIQNTELPAFLRRQAD